MKKKRNLERHCILCDKDFLAADGKAKYCYECKENSICISCDKKINLGNIRCGRCYHKYRKGMTYMEIYGTKRPNCGYKPGELNIAKRPEIRKKISNAVKESYNKNPNLRKIRSIQKTMSGFW